MKIASTVLIKSPSGYLFLERHPYDRTVSGLCLPGGKLDGSLYECGIEDPHEAVIRETLEETGIEFHVESIMYKGMYFAEPVVGKQYLINVFYTELGYTPNVKISDEHKDYRWIQDPYYLSNTLFAGTTRYAIDLCLGGVLNQKLQLLKKVFS